MTSAANHYQSRHRAIPHYNPFMSGHDAWIIEHVPSTGRAKCGDCGKLYWKYWHQDCTEETPMDYCAPCYNRRNRV